MILFSLVYSNQIQAKENKINVYVNGQNVKYDVPPQNIKGRVLVPIRLTAESLNSKVAWFQKEQSATIYDGINTVKLYLNKPFILINWEKKRIDTTPVLHNSRILVPIRFLSESLGYKVDWKGSSNSVLITSRVSKNNDITIPVLMYHHFSEGKGSPTIVNPNEFMGQLKYLKQAGYQTISNHDLLLYIEGKGKLPSKPLMITMDDGYESNYIYAFPILKQLNMKATIFVIGSVMRENNNSPYTPNAFPKLSWEQSREMHNSGLIEIQSHTYDLHKKDRSYNERIDAVIKGPIYQDGTLETIDQYYNRTKDDLNKNKRMIEEKIGNTVVAFAYPYGAYSSDSEKILKETGHLLTFTVQEGVNQKEKGTTLLKRINVSSGTTGKMIESKIIHYQ